MWYTECQYEQVLWTLYVLELADQLEL